MFKKESLKQQKSCGKLSHLKNDLVLSSDRGQGSGLINKEDSVERTIDTGKCPFHLKSIQQQELYLDVTDNLGHDTETEKKNTDRNINQKEMSDNSKYCTNEKMDTSSSAISDKFSDFNANDLEAGIFSDFCGGQSRNFGCMQSNTNTFQQAELFHSSQSFGSVQKLRVQTEHIFAAIQGRSDHCWPNIRMQLGNVNPAVHEVTRDVTKWSSSDSPTHIDTKIDQLFDDSVLEEQSKLKCMMLPQNTLSENDFNRYTYPINLDQHLQREACASDLKPSVRKRNCVIKKSSVVKSGDLKTESKTEKHPCSTVTGTHTYMEEIGNNDTVKISAMSVTDLQPSCRGKTSSYCQKRNEDKCLQDTENFNMGPTAVEHICQDQGNNTCTRKYIEESDTCNKDDNKSAEENAGCDLNGYICQEDDCRKSSQQESKKCDMSLKRHKLRNKCSKKVEETDVKEEHYCLLVSKKRRFSKSLEETGCHGYISNEMQEYLPVKRDGGGDKIKEFFQNSLQDETELSESYLNLVDRDHAKISKENKLDSHREERGNAEFTGKSHAFSTSGTKRKRYNSGQVISNKEMKSVRLNCRESGLDKKECLILKTRVLNERSKTKSKMSEKKKHVKQKSVCEHKNEQRIIHKIHKTIAESSSLGARHSTDETQDTYQVETVRIADLENMIPLDGLPCENVRKRKARLRLEKAKGALYRQVSSDGIWRSVNSKY